MARRSYLKRDFTGNRSERVTVRYSPAELLELENAERVNALRSSSRKGKRLLAAWDVADLSGLVRIGSLELAGRVVKSATRHERSLCVKRLDD